MSRHTLSNKNKTDAARYKIDMNEKALSNKMMRMKQAAEKKGGSPLKKMTGANDSPKSASPATPKMKKKSTAGKGSASTSYKRELTMDSDGYNADESEALETPSKKLKGEVVVKDEEEEYESPGERFQTASMTPEA